MRTRLVHPQGSSIKGTYRNRLFATGALVCLALIALAQPRDASAATQSFTQTENITFPDLGYGFPVPSTVSVTGLPATTSDVTLHLEDFSAAQPRDIDLLLVSPDNRSLVPISDAGGVLDVAGIELDFTDATTAVPSLAGPLAPGTYMPTDYTEVNEPMGMGAPDPPYGASFAAFDGGNPNGVWKLYGFSDFFDGGGSGSISEWRVTITADEPELQLAAKRQKLKKKIKVVATSSTAGALTLAGQVKSRTLQVPANTPTVVKLRVKGKVRKRLVSRLSKKGKAKVKVAGTVTDAAGFADGASRKVKLKG